MSDRYEAFEWCIEQAEIANNRQTIPFPDPMKIARALLAELHAAKPFLWWSPTDERTLPPDLVRYANHPEEFTTPLFLHPLFLHPPAACPEGWMLVPKEPTPEMVQAGDDLCPIARGTETHRMSGSRAPEDYYRAMLGAAPGVGDKT